MIVTADLPEDIDALKAITRHDQANGVAVSISRKMDFAADSTA